MSKIDLEQAVAAQLAKWQADPSGAVRARGLINSLPFRIAEARAARGNYCIAMTFGDPDFDRPEGRAGIHESECKPEWLKGAARLVYEHCLKLPGFHTLIGGGSPVVPLSEGGVSRVPMFAPYTFDIVVRW